MSTSKLLPFLLSKDCNYEVDDTLEFQTYYKDSDNDGFGTATNAVYACAKPNGFVLQNGNCKDDDPLIKPGVDEVCEDAKDNNCDGNINENCRLRRRG